jgi:hypothetical protein
VRRQPLTKKSHLPTNARARLICPPQPLLQTAKRILSRYPFRVLRYVAKTDIIQVLRQNTASKNDGLCATVNSNSSQPSPAPDNSKDSSNTTTLPELSPAKMTARASSESSQAEENNQLPSDTDGVPKRGWNSVDRRLAKQTVTPTKRPFGMFDQSHSPTPSPTRVRKRIPSQATPRTIARKSANNNATPNKKRTYGMFDETAREDLENPRSPRKSNNAAKSSPSQCREIQLHDRIDDSDDDVFIADTARSNGKQKAVRSLEYTSKIIGDTVASANDAHKEKMAEMFDGNHKSKDSDAITAGDGGHRTSSSLAVSLDVEPESDHETLFVGSRSKQTTEEIAESNSDTESRLYQGIPPERGETAKEYLRLEAEIENAEALTTSHQIISILLRKKVKSQPRRSMVSPAASRTNRISSTQTSTRRFAHSRRGGRCSSRLVRKMRRRRRRHCSARYTTASSKRMLSEPSWWKCRRVQRMQRRRRKRWKRLAAASRWEWTLERFERGWHRKSVEFAWPSENGDRW